MQKSNHSRKQQPEALAELAKTSREKIPGDGPRDLYADDQTKPIATQNTKKHKVAEVLLNAGAKGKKIDPDSAGENQLPDRTRLKT